MPDQPTAPERRNLRQQVERLEAATERLDRELTATNVDPLRIQALIALVNGNAALVSAHPRVRP